MDSSFFCGGGELGIALIFVTLKRESSIFCVSKGGILVERGYLQRGKGVWHLPCQNFESYYGQIINFSLLKEIVLAYDISRGKKSFFKTQKSCKNREGVQS